MTNDKSGTIKAEHKTEIVEVFGEAGKRIAERLEADPKATFLGELFRGFAE